MLLMRIVAWTLPVGMLLGVGLVFAQPDYPNKPMRLITGTAGSGGDFRPPDIAG